MKKSFLIALATTLIALLTVHAQGLRLNGNSQYSISVDDTDATSSYWDSFRCVPPRDVDGQMMIDAFVAIENDDVITRLQDNGVIVNSVFDGFVTAQVPVNRIDAISGLQGVTDVHISERMQLCTDSTMRATHVDQVLSGIDYKLPQSYDGSGVIVGIIDTGFDYSHGAFMRDDDPTKTRIVRVYNTTNTSGHPARYNNTVKLPGSVFMGDEIYGLQTPRENSGHGTHVASIAAGTHVSGYGGMAPQADIVLAALSTLDASLSTVEIANCIRYIDAYADSVGKPCVISLSVSTSMGQSDGQDYLSKAITQITGPGRIFVISAGNNGGRNSYAHKYASPSEPMNLLYKYKNSYGDSAYYYGNVHSDIFIRKPSLNYYYKIHIVDQTTGHIVWESDQFTSKRVISYSDISDYFNYYSSKDTTGYVKATTSYVSYGKKYRLEVSIHNLLCREYTTVSGVKKGRYAIGISIYPRKNVYTDIDAWICNSGSGLSTTVNPVTTLDGEVHQQFYCGGSDDCSIGSFATGDSTISVGAYAARNSYYSMASNSIISSPSVKVGDIASFSSYEVAGVGPTGKALPTVCAPGYNVIAAGSRYSIFSSSHVGTVLKTEDGCYWGVMSGTSMAAPAVAGIIALWMQANPNLSVADVLDIIQRTAIKDSFTLGSKAKRFGPNGKIDAMAGMRLVLQRLGYMMGDVNQDGLIDVSDVISLIQYVLTGMADDNFNYELADVNQDDVIDVNDVTGLTTKMLSGS